ncbi:MAG: outer membrane beta-barrel protein [Limisphaerales bacterium]
MKKIFASLGTLAVGAAAVHGMGAVDTAKTWSVGASLRGFYDDNYVTAPKGQERDTLGASISPWVGLSLPLDQTTLALKYTFGAYWYEDRRGDDWDFTHQLDAMLNHAFSERHAFYFLDSFVLAQEPQLLDPTGLTTNPYRVEGDNMRNHLKAQLNSQLTEKWSSVLGYANTWYDYEQDDKANETPLGFLLNGLNPTRSAINDRFEHTFLVNLRWQMLQETVGVLGYNYAITEYTSDEYVGLLPPGTFVPASWRDSRSHFLYAGVDHNFSRQMMLSVRLGAQDIDFHNDPTSDTDITPYGDLSLSYIYKPGSNLRVGITHTRSHTDVIAPNASATKNAITSDQQATVLYGMVTHAFTPRLTGNLSGHYQHSTFEGGAYDSKSEDFFGGSIGLSYKFTRHWYGDVGYSFDSLSSDINFRDYDRNRFYLGVSAVY